MHAWGTTSEPLRLRCTAAIPTPPQAQVVSHKWERVRNATNLSRKPKNKRTELPLNVKT